MLKPFFKIGDLIALLVQTMTKLECLIGQMLMPVVSHPQESGDAYQQHKNNRK